MGPIPMAQPNVDAVDFVSEKSCCRELKSTSQTVKREKLVEEQPSQNENKACGPNEGRNSNRQLAPLEIINFAYAWT
jgi:hypothetical protein